jgi:hypothetical protein
MAALAPHPAARVAVARALKALAHECGDAE